MRTRCFSENDGNYKDYGGRGITVCDEWLDFLIFREWALKNGYNDKLEIDRIDVNGNYNPENCRFVTDKIQASNKRDTRFYTIGEKTLCLKDWCDMYNMKFNTVAKRIKRGYDIEEALSKRPRKRIASGLYTWGGTTLKLKEWCDLFKIKYTTFLIRLQKGSDIIDALTKPVDQKKSHTKKK
jgi:hypothetical protein